MMDKISKKHANNSIEKKKKKGVKVDKKNPQKVYFQKYISSFLLDFLNNWWSHFPENLIARLHGFFLKKTVQPPFFICMYYILVTTPRPASPGFATWHRGPIDIFCHFGDFWPILILGQFVITPYSNIFFIGPAV